MVRSAVRTSLDPVSVLAVGATGLVALLVVLMGVAAEVSGLETGLLTRGPGDIGRAALVRRSVQPRHGDAVGRWRGRRGPSGCPCPQ